MSARWLPPGPPPPPPRRGKADTARRVRRLVEAEERPFDPEAPRESYASPHHFAVNGSIGEALGLDEESASVLDLAVKNALDGSREKSHDEVDTALAVANELLDGHGVEPLRAGYVFDRYYGDIAALYVNTGETYARTLLYETRDGNFIVTSVGDWVEDHQEEFEFP